MNTPLADRAAGKAPEAPKPAADPKYWAELQAAEYARASKPSKEQEESFRAACDRRGFCG